MHASIDSPSSIVRLLLDSGADVVAKDLAGWTALHYAAQSQRPDVAEILLRSGAPIDAQDSHGNTPLWRATFTSRGRGETIGVLIKSGADVNRKNTAGSSPLELARKIANYNLVRFFEEGQSLSS